MDFKIFKYSTIDSTNKEAIRLIDKGDITSNSVVIADFQTSGKGYATNKWESEKGKNLTFSIVFFSNIEISDQFIMNKALSLGIYDFLKKKIPHEKVSIKWPNDIYINNGKICGILIQNFINQNKISHSVLGIGININQTVFKSDAPNPVSLKQFTNSEHSLASTFNEVIFCIEKRLTSIFTQTHESIDKEYHSALYKFNSKCKFIIENTEVEAVVYGVNKFGQLELEIPKKGIQCFDFKEVGWIL